MSISNLAIVFGPTLMTVDSQSLSLAGMGGEYKVIDTLVSYYEWLFQMGEKTEKDLNVEEGLRKLEVAKRKHSETQRGSLVRVGHTLAQPTVFPQYPNSFVSCCISMGNCMCARLGSLTGASGRSWPGYAVYP